MFLHYIRYFKYTLLGDVLVDSDTQKKQFIKIDNNQQINNINGYVKPKQSANALFNFMKELKYLKIILNNSAIIPRYFEENINYLGLDIGKISIPVTCFCDINLQRILPHAVKYGSYGIAFHKEWCIEKGIQPVHYVNENSNMIEDFRTAFSSASNCDNNNIEIGNLENYLFSHLLFMKPICGDMTRNKEESHLNFHDEREWRYVPKISELSTDLSPILVYDKNNDATRKLYNDALIELKQTWLTFSILDVKYIIVKNAGDRENIINYIINEISNYTSQQKLLLISKLIVLEEISEDW